MGGRAGAYHLGIDLGTTYTAAAVWREGRAEIVSLGSRAQEIPSLVLLRDDGELLCGDAAERRAATEPQRVAREFKRRLGDPAPIILAGAPFAADALMARLLRWVVDKVSEAEGGPPETIVVSHPANWGEYRQDLLRQALILVDMGHATLVSEPEAAAIHYAAQERVEPGSVIAVYDLGGGTFDAAVLRKTETAWELLGEPHGVERLGGIDFDAAILQHVNTVTGKLLEQIDPSDAVATAAAARLREECVAAKVALSSDTSASIPVLLPNNHTEVRLTRSELEDMIRPALGGSIAALALALRSADVTAEEVDAVLLVGGSSRIPLVAQLIGAELGRPVAVDAHPKHAVALGAAVVAATRPAPPTDGSVSAQPGSSAAIPITAGDGLNDPPEAAEPSAEPPETEETPRVDTLQLQTVAASSEEGPGEHATVDTDEPGDWPEETPAAQRGAPRRPALLVTLVALMLAGVVGLFFWSGRPATTAGSQDEASDAESAASRRSDDGTSGGEGPNDPDDAEEEEPETGTEDDEDSEDDASDEGPGDGGGTSDDSGGSDAGETAGSGGDGAGSGDGGGGGTTAATTSPPTTTATTSPTTTAPPRVTVPDVLGMTVKNAQGTLRANRLEAGLANPECQPDRASRVTAQSVPAGKQVAPGTTVNLSLDRCF